MPRYPRIPDEVELLTIPGEGLFARRGLEYFFLGTVLHVDLLPLLDGTHDYRSIRHDLKGKTEHPERISRLLRRMVKDGHLLESPSPDPAPEMFPAAPGVAAALGSKASEYFPGGIGWLSSTRTQGPTPFPLLPPQEAAGHALLFVEDPWDERMDAWALLAESLRQSWILVQPEGPLAWVGPWFDNENGWTWSLWRKSFHRHWPVAHGLRQHHPNSRYYPARPVARPERERGIAGFLQHHAVRSDFLREGGMALWQGSDNQPQLFYRPKGQPLSNAGIPPQDILRGGATEKAPKKSSGGRSLSLSKVRKILIDFVNPVVGPVTRVESYPIHLPGEKPIYRALSWHPQRTRVPDWHVGLLDQRQPSGGHGSSAEIAEGAALAEAMERLACLPPISGIQLTHCQQNQLDLPCIGPAEIDLFDATQIPETEVPELPFEGWSAVPRPYSPRQSNLWLRAHDLTKDQPIYVPASAVYREIEPPGIRPVCIPSSNGVALGATLQEAWLFSLLELVERDAVAIWWYNRCSRPDLLAGKNILIESFAGDAASGIHLLDLTHDWGIPVVAALSIDYHNQKLSVGFGVHFSYAHAAEKALAEHQYQTRKITGPDSNAVQVMGGIQLGESLITGTWPLPSEKAIRIQADPTRPSLSAPLDEALAWCVQKAGSLGFRVLVIDQTPEKCPLPVGRVIVPGLRHFWPRFGPGRLYQKPVELGWQARVLNPAELNPVPFTL